MLQDIEERRPSRQSVRCHQDIQAHCFIETSSLDGEKNLKKRLTPKDLYLANMGRKYAYVKALCECDLPNKELYEFNGKILIPNDTSSGCENYE